MVVTDSFIRQQAEAWVTENDNVFTDMTDAFIAGAKFAFEIANANYDSEFGLDNYNFE